MGQTASSDYHHQWLQEPSPHSPEHAPEPATTFRVDGNGLVLWLRPLLLRAPLMQHQLRRLLCVVAPRRPNIKHAPTTGATATATGAGTASTTAAASPTAFATTAGCCCSCCCCEGAYCLLGIAAGHLVGEVDPAAACCSWGLRGATQADVISC